LPGDDKHVGGVRGPTNAALFAQLDGIRTTLQSNKERLAQRMFLTDAEADR